LAPVENLGVKPIRYISKIPIEITGLLEALALSDTEPSGSSLRWRSEVDLKSEDSSRPHLSSMTEDSLGNGSGRKISPPLAAVLSDASRIRLVKETLEPKYHLPGASGAPYGTQL
jgi:hypothetical protein